MRGLIDTLGKFELHRLKRLARAQEGCAMECCRRTMHPWEMGESSGPPFVLGTVDGRATVALVLGVTPDGAVNTDEGWIILDGAGQEELAQLEKRAAALRDALLRVE